MEKNFDANTMQKAMDFAQSPAGQQLIQMLRSQNPEAVQKAMSQAASGDYSQIGSTLAPLLASGEVQKLIKQLGG